MAYYNDVNNTSFYSTSASGEADTYPFLDQMTATEGANFETPEMLTNGWNVNGQPGYVTGPSTSLRPEASFEPMSSVPSYAAQANGYGQPPYMDHYWSMTGRYADSYHSNIASRDNSFAGMVASEASTVVPIPSSVPLDYWGANESGPSISTFYANVQTPRQPSTDSIRTGLTPTRRFQPYWTPRAHLDEHTNAEAGPSTLAPPLVPHMAPPTMHPSGGLSEASADAENDQTSTEEDMAPTASTRRPRGKGEKRDWRIRSQRDAHRLCAWAQEWKSLPKAQSYEKALGIALEAVETIRVPVYPKPRLIKGISKRTAQVKKGAEAERKRRKGARGANEELSRYYLLPANQRAWGCPELLLKVLEDVVGLPKPPVEQTP